MVWMYVNRKSSYFRVLSISDRTLFMSDSNRSSGRKGTIAPTKWTETTDRPSERLVKYFESKKLAYQEWKSHSFAPRFGYPLKGARSHLELICECPATKQTQTVYQSRLPTQRSCDRRLPIKYAGEKRVKNKYVFKLVTVVSQRRKILATF